MNDDDLTGATVYDSNGNDIGTIEEIYGDEGGPAQYARVKIGRLLAKHRLVPLDGVRRSAEGVTVPYSKDAIENSPDLPSDVNPMSGMVAEDLRGYYASTGDVTTTATRSTPTPTASSGSDRPSSEGEEDSGDDIPTASRGDGAPVGQVRDLGDVVEIPVVEERVVKEPVVTEVVRVRKTPGETETKTVSADVRKEDVQVESDGDAVVREVPSGD